MAFKGDGYLFFHMPRTGGSWIKHQLNHANPVGMVGMDHDWPGVYSLADLKGSFTFSVRRSPWTWLPSWFKLLARRPDWGSAFMPDLLFPGCRFDSWETFLRDYLEYSPGRIDHIYRLYAEVDQQIDFKNLEHDFEDIAKRENLDLAERRRSKIINPTPGGAIDCEWTLDLVDSVMGSDDIFGEFDAPLEVLCETAGGSNVRND